MSSGVVCRAWSWRRWARFLFSSTKNGQVLGADPYTPKYVTFYVITCGSGWPIRGSGPRWRGPAAGGAAKRSLALPASCVLGYDRWGDACPDPDATDVSVSGTMRVCDQHTVSPSVTRLRFSSKLPRLRAASKTRGKFLAGRPHRSSQCVPGFG